MASPLPSVLVVMGVSGSGKTTVAALLAGRLGWEFGDADDFHSPANVAKMHGGTPLTDADRAPWLESMAAWIDATRAIGRHGVLACSALKRSYRQVLVGSRGDVRLVYLRGDKALIATRQGARHNHFMPASLVDSQFATLEEPGPEEHPFTLSVAPRPPDIVEGIVQAIRGVSDAMKREAAEASLQDVEDGMVLGLGTGSTAALMVEALGRRVAQGLRVVGIPTSERTAVQAAALGIPLVDFSTHPSIDLTIDGADEVHTGTLDLIKGLGGALLREKIVAAASRRMTVIVDAAKLVPRLGRVRLPVEVVAFGWQTTAARLRDAGADPALRQGPGGAPFRTDGGNLILDCAFPSIEDAPGLAARLKAVTGVVETGLFIAMATTVLAGTATGLQRLERA